MQVWKNTGLNFGTPKKRNILENKLERSGGGLKNKYLHLKYKQLNVKF